MLHPEVFHRLFNIESVFSTEFPTETGENRLKTRSFPQALFFLSFLFKRNQFLILPYILPVLSCTVLFCSYLTCSVLYRHFCHPAHMAKMALPCLPCRRICEKWAWHVAIFPPCFGGKFRCPLCLTDGGIRSIIFLVEQRRSRIYCA